MTAIEPGAALRAVRLHMRGPFDWGASDCCAAACAAFEDLHGADPMGQVRGTYRTALQAAAIVAEAGGYREWCRARFAAAGLIRCDDPAAGDLALVPWSPPFGHCLGLMVRPGAVAVKGALGPSFWNGKPREGWTCLGSARR